MCGGESMKKSFSAGHSMYSGTWITDKLAAGNLSIVGGTLSLSWRLTTTHLNPKVDPIEGCGFREVDTEDTFRTDNWAKDYLWLTNWNVLQSDGTIKFCQFSRVKGCPYLRGWKCISSMVKSTGGIYVVSTVHCIQVICISESPLMMVSLYLANRLLEQCSLHTFFSSSADCWRSGPFQENPPMLATTSVMFPTFASTFFCSSPTLSSESTVVKSTLTYTVLWNSVN